MSLRSRVRLAWRVLTGARRETRETYKGAAINRLTSDWLANAARADDAIKRSLRLLRMRGRDLSVNSSTVRYFRMLLATNVIGPTGLRLQALIRKSPDTLDEAANAVIEEGWADWSHARVSVDGRHTLVGFEQLALKTVATEGEIFVRIHRGFPNEFGFALQLIDPDQVDEQLNREPGRGVSEIRLGVEVDGFGRPVAYHVFDERRGQPASAASRARVLASDMIHLYLPERAYQTRGVTWLHSAMFPIKMMEGYREAELVAARTAAAKMGFIQQRENSLVGEMGAGDGTPSAPEPMEANAGVWEVLDPGYEAIGFDPQHPTTAFAPFIQSLMRDVASGLGVSYNALANDLVGVNFSSMRSGLQIERDLWRTLQQWWIDSFSIPIYREWLNAALLKRRLALPSPDFRRYTRVRFVPRGWAWVDPLKDAQTSALGIQTGLLSRQQILSEQGYDFDETLRQLAAEQAAAAKLGVSIDPPQGGAPESTKEDDEDEKEDGTTKDAEGTNGNGDRGRLAGHLSHS